MYYKSDNTICVCHTSALSFSVTYFIKILCFCFCFFQCEFVSNFVKVLHCCLATLGLSTGPDHLLHSVTVTLCFCLPPQLGARPPVGQAAVCGGVGLGPHVQERLHGGAVVRRERDLPATHQRLVQTAGPRWGRVLQHPGTGSGPAGKKTHSGPSPSPDLPS